MKPERTGTTPCARSDSRRGFLIAAAFAAGGASLLHERPSAADEERASGKTCIEGTASQTGDCKVFRGVCEQHYDLLRLRTATNHQAIAASLRKADARPVTVAAWQMHNRCGGPQGKRENCRRMVEAMGHASRAGVQILAFPEMCLPGYFTPAAGTPAEAARPNHRLADRVGHSEELARLAAAARTHRMVVAFGFCERDGDNDYNSIGVIDADGSWLGTRRKNPLSPSPCDTESFAQPDPAECSAVFRTRYATIGVANCFDGEFPESVRRMRLAGAEILLWCNAGTGNVKLGSSNRLHHSASYAEANLMWVVCCNAMGGDCYGTSLIVGPSGDPLVVLPTDQEALGVATINLASSADWDRYRLRLDPKWR
jgi:N-carbamoylputrescine amidase